MYKGKVKHLLGCIVLSTLFLSNAQGQSNQNLNQLTGQVATDEGRDYSVTLSQTLSSNAYKPSSVSFAAAHETNVIINGADKYGNNFTLTLNGEKELTDERKFNFLDGSVRVSRPVYRRGEFIMMARASALIPMSELTKDDRQMITSTTLSTSNIYTPRKVPGLALIYIPNATVFFNRYKTSLSGLSNYKYRIGNTLVSSYSYKAWNATLVAAYLRSFTYQNNTVDLYQFDISGTYSFTQQITLSVGFANVASPLSTNGQSNIIRVYDPERSILYTNLGMTF